MYHTGLDPMTGQEGYVPKGARGPRLHRALPQYWMPENYALVRQALEQAGRPDLIGDGPECLIPSKPPKGAGRRPPARRQIGKSAPSGPGYRPHRKTSRRRGAPPADAVEG